MTTTEETTETTSGLEPTEPNPALAVATKIGKYSAAVIVWIVQYGAVVPMYACWRAIAWTFKIFGITAVLLFIPFIGWAILALMYFSKKSAKQRDRHHAETMAALTGTDVSMSKVDKTSWRPMTSPWLLDWVKTS